MNLRRAITPIIVVALLLLAAATVRLSAPGQTLLNAPPPEVAAAPAIAPPAALQPRGLPELSRAEVQADPAVDEVIAGVMMTQTFTLQAGWNSIYLGVEPVNPSPLVNQGTADKPVWMHEKSTIAAVFAGLAATGNLQSVWTYNQPASHQDYIVDPGEGLWDAPGWLRYIPKEAVGADGQSQGFLTNLGGLHANTAYLVKLKESAPAATLTIYGKPAPGHHHWAAGAYNFSGFALSGSGVTVDVLKGAAEGSITELRAVTADGKWTAPLAGTDRVAPGTAYLVRYADEPAVPDFTAPLDIGQGSAGQISGTGLAFKAGALGQSVDLLVKNAAAVSATVTLQLPEGSASGVALHYLAHTEDGDTLLDLTEGPASFPVAAGSGQHVTLQVPAKEQLESGETLLEVGSADLGTRWLIPVTAEAGSLAGLWVGDVVVNDVSEGRLGSTDFEKDVAVSLQPVGGSGVLGSVQAHETVEGATSTLAFTISLTLPQLTAPSGSPAWQGLNVPGPGYAYGWVFVDLNQNGQHDGGEPGLANATVSLGGRSTESQADGSYVQQLDPGTYSVAVSGAPADGFTTAFTVALPTKTTGEDPLNPEEPVVTANRVPQSIVLESAGLASVAPPEYLQQVIGQATLPFYDTNDNRFEPPLNFGFVRMDAAEVYERTCDEAAAGQGGKLFDLGPVRNGKLIVTVPNTKLSDLIGKANVRISWKGQTVACGNLVIGSPTQFADGRGSQAKFRVVLRVNQAGQTGILPYYAIDETQRVSSAMFLSLQQAVTITGPFGVSGEPLQYDLTLRANDPLNPYKHKYHPDHDNLDAKFQNYQQESFDVERKVTFILTDLPYGADAETAVALDWGGVVWGGDYREVVGQGSLFKNTITARGYFVIRHVLTWDQLVTQEYDK